MKKGIRTCQPCTGCCDGWVQMVINGAEVYPGAPCPHSTGKGCDDYENRPANPCDTFKCGWIVPNSPLPEWLKPNEGQVIVIFNKFKWNGNAVDLAVPVGERIPDRSLEWMKQFSEKNLRPLVYTEQIIEDGKYQKRQQLLAYGPPAFQQDMARYQQEGMELW